MATRRRTPPRGERFVDDDSTPEWYRRKQSEEIDMARFWAAVNGTKVLLTLLGLVIAGALWAYDLKRDLDEMDRNGTTRLRARSSEVDTKIRDVSAEVRETRREVEKLHRNLLRLGARMNVPMEGAQEQD